MAALDCQFYHPLGPQVCVDRRLKPAYFRILTSFSEYRDTNRIKILTCHWAWFNPFCYIISTGDPRISWFHNLWSLLFRDCFRPQIREFPLHFGILTKKKAKKNFFWKIFGNFLEFFFGWIFNSVQKSYVYYELKLIVT